MGPYSTFVFYKKSFIIREMAKMGISDRIVFSKKGEQRSFIIQVRATLNLSSKALADFLKIHQRTVTDWAREKYKMSHPAAVSLSKKSGLPLPDDSYIFSWHNHLQSIAGIAGKLVYKKYGRVGGNPMIRKTKWLEWWNKKGKFLRWTILKRGDIRLPERNYDLAEFAGIMMGDGGISTKQVFITLHSEDDHEYSLYVMKLIRNLFQVIPSLRYRKDAKAIDIVVSRKNLVDFCVQIGLKVGNKIRQGLDIPVWIMRNEQFQKACIRGLVDTDGCLFFHRYTVNGKQYIYKKINFCSASPPLINSVFKIFSKLGFRPRITYDKRQIYLDSQTDVKNYFNIIGSSNAKILKKFQGEVPKRLKGGVC